MIWKSPPEAPYLQSRIRKYSNIYRRVEQLVARRAHNPKVASSSLVPATKKRPWFHNRGLLNLIRSGPFKKTENIYRRVEQLVARRAHNPKVASSSLVPATKEAS